MIEGDGYPFLDTLLSGGIDTGRTSHSEYQPPVNFPGGSLQSADRPMEFHLGKCPTLQDLVIPEL